MEIRNNSIQQYRQPAFGAIKIVKCTNSDVKEIITNCAPILQLDSHKLFKGKSILHSDVANGIFEQAKKMGYSPEWLIQNAENHGVEFTKTEPYPFFDVSGDDVVAFSKYRLKQALKMLGYNFKHQFKPEIQALPSHLRWLKTLNDFADKEQAGFEKFLEKHNAVEMDVPSYIASLIVDGIFRH